MAVSGGKVKYLFVAQYRDGTLYEQNPEDQSVSDPERSCFFDVRVNDVERFIFFEGKGLDHTPTLALLVDLNDGHFEINGVPFRLHEAGELFDAELQAEVRPELVFWRRHQHQFQLTKEEIEEKSHSIAYRLGWRATVNGRTIEHVVEID